MWIESCKKVPAKLLTAARPGRSAVIEKDKFTLMLKRKMLSLGKGKCVSLRSPSIQIRGQAKLVAVEPIESSRNPEFPISKSRSRPKRKMAAPSRKVDASSPHETAPGVNSLPGLVTVLKVIVATSAIILVGFLIRKSKKRHSRVVYEDDDRQLLLSPTTERSYDLRDQPKQQGADAKGGGLVKFFGSKIGLGSSTKKDEAAAESSGFIDLETGLMRPGSSLRERSKIDGREDRCREY